MKGGIALPQDYCEDPDAGTCQYIEKADLALPWDPW